jgi:hypothetical protein
MHPVPVPSSTLPDIETRGEALFPTFEGRSDEGTWGLVEDGIGPWHVVEDVGGLVRPRRQGGEGATAELDVSTAVDQHARCPHMTPAARRVRPADYTPA